MPRTATKKSDSATIVGRLAAIIGMGGQGRALARTLAREGVRSRTHLRRAAVLARLPREARSRVLYSPVVRVPAATARIIADEVVRRARVRIGGRLRHLEIIPVGSVRRGATTVKDVDFLVVAPPASVDEALAGIELRGAGRVTIADNYAAGGRRRSFMLRFGRRHYRSDFFVTTPAEKPYALYHFTGPSAYNIRVRAVAKRRGWLLNQYGLFVAATREPVRGSSAVATERDLAEFIGVTYRLPADRV